MTGRRSQTRSCRFSTFGAMYLTYNKLGDAYLNLNDVPSARNVFQSGLEISQKLAQTKSAQFQAEWDSCSVRTARLGDVCLLTKSMSGARDNYQKSLNTRR